MISHYISRKKRGLCVILPPDHLEVPEPVPPEDLQNLLIRVAPGHQPLRNILYVARVRDVAAELTRYVYGSDVDTVIIDGEIVIEDRVINTVDESEVLAEAKRIGETVYEETKDRMSKTVPVNRWKVI